MALTVPTQQHIGCAQFPSGLDLSAYGQQLVNEQENRTNRMRSNKSKNTYFFNFDQHSSCSSSNNNNNSFNMGRSVSIGVLLGKEKEVENVYQILVQTISFLSSDNNNNTIAENEVKQKVKSLNEKFLQLNKEDRVVLVKIADSSEMTDMFVEAANAAQNSNNSEIFIMILNLVTFIFQFTAERYQIKYVDELTLTVSSILDENKNILINNINDTNYDLLCAALQMVAVFAKNSTYARDSITCYGIQTILFELIVAVQSLNDGFVNILNLCCLSIHSIFSNHGKIDDWTINSSIDHLIEIMVNGRSEVVLKTAFDCLTDITNHKPSVVVRLCGNYESSTFCFAHFLVTLLGNNILNIQSPKNIELILSLLKLIGNVTTSTPSICQTMIDGGLFSKMIFILNLYDQISSQICNENVVDLISDVFWIISNLLNMLPIAASALTSIEFIRTVINQGPKMQTDIKKEMTYFLATCVFSMDAEKVRSFVNLEFILLLDEMLSSGKNDLIIRCEDAIFRLLLIFAEDNFLIDILSYLSEVDIVNDLEELIGSDDEMISGRSLALFKRLTCLYAKFE